MKKKTLKPGLLAPEQIQDELCMCGAKRSEHAPREHELPAIKRVVSIPGHGPCAKTNCARFTFKDWILKTVTVLALVLLVGCGKAETPKPKPTPTVTPSPTGRISGKVPKRPGECLTCGGQR